MLTTFERLQLALGALAIGVAMTAAPILMALAMVSK